MMPFFRDPLDANLQEHGLMRVLALIVSIYWRRATRRG